MWHRRLSHSLQDLDPEPLDLAEVPLVGWAVIFLLGPPGAGKSALGRRACTELGIEFLDLGAAMATPTVNDPRSDLDRVLTHFNHPPWELEFRRKFTDRPALVARYRHSLQGFARFLRDVDPQ